MSNRAKSLERQPKTTGNSRLEMLLFRLQKKQRFGINVYKVREVLQCPALTAVPGSHTVLKGVITLRGATIPVIDLSLAVGMGPNSDTQSAYVIVAEFNRIVQGFLVAAVERIVHVNWEDVVSPPQSSGLDHFLTGVTTLDNDLVEILDVEKVFADINPVCAKVGSANQESARASGVDSAHVLVVDDSRIARKQIEETLNQLSVPFTSAVHGKQAIAILQKWMTESPEKLATLLMVITDIEMPEMDGYALLSEIRKDARLASLYVVLHSSLSSMLNKQSVERSGANDFIAKFNAEELGKKVNERLTSVKNCVTK